MLKEYPKLLTVKQFCKEFIAFAEGTIRALIFNAENNGFNKVIVRICPTGGRGRILINVEKFFYWLEEQQVING